MVRCLVVATLLLVLLPASTPTRGIQAAPAGQSLSTCQNIQLLLRPYGSNGAAGHIGVIYQIYNLTGRPCSLYGYPGVELLDKHFHSLPTSVRRGGLLGNIPERGVTLGAYGHAYFTLMFSDVPVGNAPCQPPAHYLMVWAPNDYLPVVTYAWTDGGSIYSCTGGIDVSPVTTGPQY